MCGRENRHTDIVKSLTDRHRNEEKREGKKKEN